MDRGEAGVEIRGKGQEGGSVAEKVGSCTSMSVQPHIIQLILLLLVFGSIC